MAEPGQANGTLKSGYAILSLAGLGCRGLGSEPSAGAEGGYDLSTAIPDAAAGIWWTGTCPGIAIVLMVVGVTLVGESLNDVLNPLLRARRLAQVVIPGRIRRQRETAIVPERLADDDTADAPDGPEQTDRSADGSMDTTNGQGTSGGSR